MNVEAALGIAGGAWIAVAVAGFWRVHNWQRATRLAAIVGAALALGALGGAALAEFPAPPPQAVMAAAAIVLGGSVYSLRIEVSTLTVLAGGIVLAYAALTGAGDQATPPSTIGLVMVLVSSLSLPALDVSIRAWHNTRMRFAAACALWAGVSAAVVVGAATSLVQHGAWFGSTPGDAGVLAAWIASSAGLLVRPGRPRAVLMCAAALIVALSAQSP